MFFCCSFLAFWVNWNFKKCSFYFICFLLHLFLFIFSDCSRPSNTSFNLIKVNIVLPAHFILCLGEVILFLNFLFTCYYFSSLFFLSLSFPFWKLNRKFPVWITMKWVESRSEKTVPVSKKHLRTKVGKYSTAILYYLLLFRTNSWIGEADCSYCYS